MFACYTFSSNLLARRFISIMFYLADDVFWCSMSIGYFDSYHYHFILADNSWFKDLRFVDTLDIDYLVDSSIESAIWPHIRTVWCNTDMFHLKLLIRFSLLVNCRSNWLACCWIFRIDWLCVEAKQIFGLIPLKSSGLLCWSHRHIFVSTHFLTHLVGP